MDEASPAWAGLGLDLEINSGPLTLAGLGLSGRKLKAQTECEARFK